MPAQISHFNRKGARDRLQPVYDLLFKAYPLHQDYGGGFNAFLDLHESDPPDIEFLINKAESYARNVDPNELKYVPLLKNWIKGRRFEDEDLFTDQAVSTREWFVRAYGAGDAAAVEKKYGFVFGDPAVPTDCEDVGAWHRDARKSWIGAVARHVLHGEPLPE